VKITIVKTSISFNILYIVIWLFWWFGFIKDRNSVLWIFLILKLFKSMNYFLINYYTNNNFDNLISLFKVKNIVGVVTSHIFHIIRTLLHRNSIISLNKNIHKSIWKYASLHET